MTTPFSRTASGTAQGGEPVASMSRPHSGWIALGAVSVIFHLGLIFYGLTPALVSRPLHMALALLWILVFAAKTPWQRWSGWGLSLAGIAACAYIALNEDALSSQYGFIDSALQMGIGAFLIMLALETARRAIGWPLPMVAACALLYGLSATSFPGNSVIPAFRYRVSSAR